MTRPENSFQNYQTSPFSLFGCTSFRLLIFIFTKNETAQPGRHCRNGHRRSWVTMNHARCLPSLLRLHCSRRRWWDNFCSVSSPAPPRPFPPATHLRVAATATTYFGKAIDYRAARNANLPFGLFCHGGGGRRSSGGNLIRFAFINFPVAVDVPSVTCCRLQIRHSAHGSLVVVSVVCKKKYKNLAPKDKISPDVSSDQSPASCGSFPSNGNQTTCQHYVIVLVE